MKSLFVVCICIFFSAQLQSQTNYDSLNTERNLLLKEISSLHSKVEIIEKEILKDILKNGYKISFKESYSGEVKKVYSEPGTGEVIMEVKNGDEIIFIGKERIYYKVKVEERIGYVYISSINLTYPIKLLDEYKYKDLVEGKSQEGSTKYKSSSSKVYKSSSSCSSRQCSGTTQSGRRCRNKTTNCSGRCYRH